MSHKLSCASMYGPVCTNTVNKIDEKGFVYCDCCGTRRKASGVKCRKLKPSELNILKNGKALKKY